MTLLRRLIQGAIQVAAATGVEDVIASSAWRRRRLLILCYHGFSLRDEHRWNPSLYITANQFERRLQLLRDARASLLPFGEAITRLEAGTLPPRAVALTVDDGAYDFLAVAQPILRRYQAPVTLYCSTWYMQHQWPVFNVMLRYLLWRGVENGVGQIHLDDTGTPAVLAGREEAELLAGRIEEGAAADGLSAEEKHHLLERLAGQVGEDMARLTESRLFSLLHLDELAQLDRNLVDVQLHTHRHRTPRDRAAFLAEIVANRAVLAESGVPAEGLKHFCYPSGHHETEFLPWLRAVGVETATTCEPRLAGPDDDPLVLPRFVDAGTIPDAEFLAWVSGVRHLIRRRPPPSPPASMPAGAQRSLHVLLVAESYPPSPYVGSIRPAALAAALHAAGHRVTVIRSARYAAPPSAESTDSEETVITVEPPENPIRVLARQKVLRVLSRPGPADGTPARMGTRRSVFKRLRRWILSLALLPDDSQGFLLPATRAARRRHRELPVDLLVTTGPPFTDHLIGSWLARRLGVPWAAEFRDPWLPRAPQRELRSGLADWLEQRLEDRVLKRCNLVVAVTPSIGAQLDRKRLALGRPAGTVVALNGIPAFQPCAARPTGPIQVLHAGVLYLGRNPLPFLTTIAKGVHSGQFGPDGVRVRFMGAAGGHFNGRPVEALAADLGIADSVELVGQLPIAECRRLMAEADALLLLAQDQPTQIPNKLYDYLAARRPIIAYADPGGESATILERVGGHLLVSDGSPDRDDGIIQAILASRRTVTGTGMDKAALDDLRTEVQLAPVVAALEQLAASR